MYQFFVEKENVGPKRIYITGGDVNHIKNVLRMKPGEKIRISCITGKSYFCRISEINPEIVWAEIEEEDNRGTEFSHKIYLFQGLPKSDKMEYIIQKAVELGVCEIIPVRMKNCVVKLDEKKVDGKVKRWNMIAESAAKQSKRSVIPQVHAPMGWKQMLTFIQEQNLFTLVPYENERGMDATRELISGITKPIPIGIVIGPEGGFDPREITEIRKQMDCHCISLGRRILRTETAGMATLAMLIYALDE